MSYISSIEITKYYKAFLLLYRVFARQIENFNFNHFEFSLQTKIALVGYICLDKYIFVARDKNVSAKFETTCFQGVQLKLTFAKTKSIRAGLPEAV